VESSSRLKVAHVRGPALRCPSLEQSMDFLHAFLGLYPWRIEAGVGGRRARYPLAGDTSLELLERGPTSNGRRVGWLGITLVLDPELSPGLRAAATGIDGLAHPRDAVPADRLGARDTAGVALSFIWGGPREAANTRAGFVRANTRVVDRVLGISIVSEEPEAAAVAYARFGLSFSPLPSDAGDFVLHADCASGSFLQIRTPMDGEAPSADALQKQGAGLFHLALGVHDLGRVTDAVDRVGARIARSASPRSVWTDPESTLGIPIEFREL
jgi:catechol 2,3-dioxygenase-like lactoylglutathione lyase family enzyme